MVGLPLGTAWRKAVGKSTNGGGRWSPVGLPPPWPGEAPLEALLRPAAELMRLLGRCHLTYVELLWTLRPIKAEPCLR